MQYIIGLNGPPKSGKDTIAAALRELFDEHCLIPTMIDHLARPMREMAMNLVGLDPADMSLYNAEKDKPQTLLKRSLGGDFDSLRELMIYTSEECVKRRYGQDFWGRKLILDHAHWIAQGVPGVLIVPDIGFPSEVGFFDKLFGNLPPLRTLIVQVERPGVGWANDSRVPCYGERWNLPLLNNSTPHDAARLIMKHMIHELEWQFDCQ